MNTELQSEKKYEYDFALSFAGEDRDFVLKVAEWLRFLGATVFYDAWEVDRLIGLDLYAHFASLYRDRAHYCVLFMSQNYSQKMWTAHERKFAEARAFEQSGRYILPVRLDDSKHTTIPATVAYLDGRRLSASQIALVLMKVLGKEFTTGDCCELVTRAESIYSIFWNGGFSGKINTTYMFLGQKPRAHHCHNLWAAEGGTLDVVSFCASDSHGTLQTRMNSQTDKRQHWDILFRQPLEYGSVVELTKLYRCRNYFTNLFDLCEDTFGIGLRTRKTSMTFRFPRRARLADLSITRIFEGNEFGEKHSVQHENDVMSVQFSHEEPRVGTKWRIRFRLAR